LDGCSISIGEEGYGQQRICVDCQQINNVQDIIATKEIENWQQLTHNLKEDTYKRIVYEMNFY